MGLFEHFPFTNFHEKNLDWILRELKELSDRMDDAEDRLDAAEARLDDAEARLDVVEQEIANILSEITIIQNDITALTTRITNAESAITALQTRAGNLETRMTAAENAITALQTRAGNLETRMTAAESAITALQAREQIPAHTASDNGKVLTVNASNTLIWAIPAGGGLPAIAAGDAGKVLKVNNSEDGVEWAAASSGGSVVYIQFSNTLTPSNIKAVIDAGNIPVLYVNVTGGKRFAVLSWCEETYGDLTCGFFDAGGLSYAAGVQGATSRDPGILEYYQAWDFNHLA